MQRTLILTGSTGGLGTEVVQRLRGAYRLVELSRDNGVDLNEPASVRTAIRAAGTAPYGLVHLAGGFSPGSLAETSDETWTHMLSLNLTAAFTVIRETLAVMQRGEPGRVIAISSAASLERAPGMAAYTIAKNGLNALIQIAAADLRGTGITANAILPTALDTPAMRKEMPREKLVPLARVCDTIEFLLSDSAANLSGALLPLGAP